MAAMNLNKELFEKLVNGDKPVLVDYWAPWCGYCRRIANAYEKVAEQYEGQLFVAKLNVDEEPALAAQQGIEVIPTLVLYKGGKVLGSVVAPPSKAAIDEFIRASLEG